MVKFCCSVNDGEYKEVMTYNQILDKVESDETQADGIWKFKSINAHQGPLTTRDPAYKGSKWNAQVNWENGEITYEPLSLITKDDLLTCATHAKDNNLLHLEEWKRFKGLAKRQKKSLYLVNQEKLRSFKHGTKRHKFRVEVPRDHKDAMCLDELNGNKLWKEAEGHELGQIDEYMILLMTYKKETLN